MDSDRHLPPPTLAEALGTPCPHCGSTHILVQEISVEPHRLTLRCVDCGHHRYVHYSPDAT